MVKKVSRKIAENEKASRAEPLQCPRCGYETEMIIIKEWTHCSKCNYSFKVELGEYGRKPTKAVLEELGLNVSDDADGQTVGRSDRVQYAFPTKSPCPRCGGTNTISRRTAGDTQYRVCRSAVCRRKYSVKGTVV